MQLYYPRYTYCYIKWGSVIFHDFHNLNDRRHRYELKEFFPVLPSYSFCSLPYKLVNPEKKYVIVEVHYNAK